MLTLLFCRVVVAVVFRRRDFNDEVFQSPNCSAFFDQHTYRLASSTSSHRLYVVSATVICHIDWLRNIIKWISSRRRHLDSSYRTSLPTSRWQNPNTLVLVVTIDLDLLNGCMAHLSSVTESPRSLLQSSPKSSDLNLLWSASSLRSITLHTMESLIATYVYFKRGQRTRELGG